MLRPVSDGGRGGTTFTPTVMPTTPWTFWHTFWAAASRAAAPRAATSGLASTTTSRVSRGALAAHHQHVVGLALRHAHQQALDPYESGSRGRFRSHPQPRPTPVG